MSLELILHNLCKHNIISSRALNIIIGKQSIQLNHAVRCSYPWLSGLSSYKFYMAPLPPPFVNAACTVGLEYALPVNTMLWVWIFRARSVHLFFFQTGGDKSNRYIQIQWERNICIVTPARQGKVDVLLTIMNSLPRARAETLHQPL